MPSSEIDLAIDPGNHFEILTCLSEKQRPDQFGYITSVVYSNILRPVIKTKKNKKKHSLIVCSVVVLLLLPAKSRRSVVVSEVSA